MSFAPDAFRDPVNPYYVPYDNTTQITADIQVSTIATNPTGAIILSSSSTNPDLTTPIIFDRVTGQQPAYFAMNRNTTGIGQTSDDITALNFSRTAYETVATGNLLLYGNALVGQNPIAQFVEQGMSGNLTILSPQVNISTLNSANIIGVSTINGAVYPPPGSGSNISTFSTIFVSSLFATNASISTLTVSSVIGFSGGITTSNITSQTILTSTLSFAPSVGGITPKIDLGMGGFLGGLAGQGAGVLGAGLGAVALGTGIAGLAMPRTTNNINSNVFETINGTTQLQVSTLGSVVSSILRFVSSASTTLPGREIFVSTVIASGTTCIRSISDPLNLANSNFQTSTIQSFGQWTALPVGSGGGGGNVIPDLVVSSINSISWDQIQYANQQPVTEPGNFIVVDATNQYLYVGATIFSPTIQYEFQEIILDTGTYTLREFVDMVDAASTSQGVGAGQIRCGLNVTGSNVSFNLLVNPFLPFPQSYALIWNPTPLSNFPFASFTPPITAPALAASSAIFGANSTNIFLQTLNGTDVQVLPLTPTLTPNPIGPISFGANLQVSSIAFPSNTSSNAGAIQMNGLFGMYNLATHATQPAYQFNAATSIGGTLGSVLAVCSPNIVHQVTVAADNSNGPQIIATTSNVRGQLSLQASRVNVSSIYLSSINGAVYPPPATTILSTFQYLNTSSFVVSSINGAIYPPPGTQTVSTFQNLFTSTFNVSTINGTNWSNISFQNQGPAIDPSNRNWVVTGSNNILCVIASNPTPAPGFIQFGGIPLTVGTYDNTSFPGMVNTAIQTFSAANGGYWQYLRASVPPGSIIRAAFSNTSPVPSPPLVGTQYLIDFTPGDFGQFPGSSALLIAGSAALFGGSNPSSVTIAPSSPGIPGPLVVLPFPNTTPFVGPVVPFGPNLQLSSLTLSGIPISPSIIITGTVVMYAGSILPNGYLWCDGSTYSTATYPALFAIIGYTYGGSVANFNVPDLQVRVPVGGVTTNTAIPVKYTIPSNEAFTGSTVLIQTMATAPATNPLNVIYVGMQCTGFPIPDLGTILIASVLYQDGSGNYLVTINKTIGYAPLPGPGGGNITSFGTVIPQTTGAFEAGFSTPPIYIPSLTASQMAPHTHSLTRYKGGLTVPPVDGATAAVGFPNVGAANDLTSNGIIQSATQPAPNPTGLGMDMSTLWGVNPPVGFTNQNYPQGVAPQPYTVVNYMIKV
jgi:hypothetical protein